MPELSGIEISVLVKEISSRLQGTYVNNVYSIGETQLLRLRRPGEDDFWIVASPRFGAWVSGKVSERAETTPFTSRLRGELTRTRTEGVKQLDLDRIYDFSFAGAEKTIHMLVELMPPGNIVIADSAGRIRLALREFRTATRSVAVRGIYTPPPQKRTSPEDADGTKLAEILRTERTLGQAVGRNFALPKKYVREVLHRLSLAESAPAPSAVDRADELAAALRGIVMEARSSPTPCICETPDGAEVFAVRPRAFAVTKEAESLGALCDELFLPTILQEVQQVPKVGSKKGELESTLKRLKEEDIDLTEEAIRLRELAKSAGRASSAEEASSLLVGIQGSLPQKEPRSPAAVSSLLYDLAKDAEVRAEEVRGAARKISRRLQKESANVERATKDLKRGHHEWYEKFRWFYTSQEKLAIGGRDAQSNTIIIRRHLEKNDTVYHADLFGSPFFVLKNGREQTPEEILELAQATVSFSSAWKTGLSAADAYWVGPDQVGSAAPSGEYLPRGSFMIKGKKNFVPHILVQVTIGVDESGRVTAGPESAISKHAVGFVVLSPHREKLSETAKKVANELEPLGISPRDSLDDVARALPTGGGKVVRKKTTRLQPSDNM